MDKPNKSKSLLFHKAHKEAKKGMKEHMERERVQHEAQLQKARDEWRNQ